MDEIWKGQSKTDWNIKRIIHSKHVDAQSLQKRQQNKVYYKFKVNIKDTRRRSGVL